jgi:bifunctional non-homologous end joining protein LigD
VDLTRLPKYRPQLATLVVEPPAGAAWLHEIKFDGYRIGCSIEDGKVRLESRRNRVWTAEFPEIARAAQDLPARAALLDGEVAILLPSGLTSFQALQNSFSGSPRTGLTYFVFDLLHIDGRNLAELPLERRKRECEELLRGQSDSSPIRYSQHFDTDGTALLARACALGAEGIISKRRDQPYQPGRGSDWLKAKCTKRGAFVIGGFTPPAGSRSGIGALLLGYYDSGRLRYAGKVGTGPGFTAEYLARIRRELAAIEQPVCPFDPAPPGWIGRHGHWVRPERTGDVTYTEWTDGGTLRHPSFQGFHAKPAGLLAARPARSSADAPEALRGVLSAPGGPATVEPRGGLPEAGVAVTSPDRLIYPALNFNKRDLAQFYADIARWMLPYVANRPLTLVRCERGIRSEDGLRQECRFLPHEAAWYRWAAPPIRRVQIQEQKKIGEYLVVDSAEGLAALVQGDILEIHCWNSTVDSLETPDRIVLDLDPGAGVAWAQVVAAALRVRALLTSLGLQCWPKLTGGKGVHVVVPFQPEHGWDAVYELARRLAQAVVQGDPDLFTLDFAKQKRPRKILIDFKRNHRGAVAVAAYSARARPHGAVGVPLSWRQLLACRSPDYWTVSNVRQRQRRLKADPWRDFWSCRQRLTR